MKARILFCCSALIPTPLYANPVINKTDGKWLTLLQESGIPVKSFSNTSETVSQILA